jgi:hypothetical protein
LLSCDAIPIQDLLLLKFKAGNSVKDDIDNLVKQVETVGYNTILPFPDIVASSSEQLLSLIARENKNFAGDILGFLKSNFFIKQKRPYNDIVVFSKRRDLPSDKKIIILSATANQWIYQRLYGNRISFVDIGNIRTIGEIIQYSRRSCSRDSLKKDKEFFDKVKQLHGDKPVITFKVYDDDNIAHFNALEGLDEFNGKDLVIVGTPHVNNAVYFLFAAQLGIKFDMFDSFTFSYQEVHRNGYIFDFNTFSENKDLQEIQFFFIESELLQAIGRARILRNQCTVYLFSNYPIPGAKIIQDSMTKLLQSA